MSEPRLVLEQDCEHGFGFEDYHCDHGRKGAHGALCPTASWCDAGSRRVLDPEQVVTVEQAAIFKSVTVTVRDIIDALAALEGREP